MKNELKILGKNGNLYSLEEYLKLQGNTYHYAVGIIFESPIIGKRVLVFDSWKEKWANEEKKYTKCLSESEAIQSLCGSDNTERIVEIQDYEDDMTAAKRCWEYKAGCLQWYLPSLMELGVIYTFRDEINEAMKLLGCESDCLLPTACNTAVWSNSENGKSHSWLIRFNTGCFDICCKSSSLIVRAVATLPKESGISPDFEEHNPTLGKTYFVPNIKDLPDAELATELRNRGFKGELTKEIKLIV